MTNERGKTSRPPVVSVVSHGYRGALRRAVRVALLGQMPSALEFAGGAVMFAGVILVRLDETRQAARRKCLSPPA
jgi:drug/metabolite transporter (DMT)-like permease